MRHLNRNTARAYREVNDIVQDGGHTHAGIRVDALGSTQSGPVIAISKCDIVIVNFRGEEVYRPLDDLDVHSIYRCTDRSCSYR